MVCGRGTMMSFCEPYLCRSPFECFPPDNASYAEASHRFEDYAQAPAENRPMHAFAHLERLAHAKSFAPCVSRSGGFALSKASGLFHKKLQAWADSRQIGIRETKVRRLLNSGGQTRWSVFLHCPLRVSWLESNRLHVTPD